MSLLGVAVVLVAAQAGGDAVEPKPAAERAAATEPMSAAERAAAAAERAAAAAEKAAEAALRVVESVAPKAKPAPEAEKLPDRKADNWVGSVGAGLTFITGNSQTLTITGTTSADRKWEKWLLGIRLNGAYGLANPSANVGASTTSTTARRASGTLRGDRTFGDFVSLFGLAGIEMDHVKNIESRSIVELGTGLTFFKLKEGDLEKLYLRLDLAMRGGYETRYQYFPRPVPIVPYGILVLAPRAATTLRWNLTKDVRFSEELELIPFVLAPNAGRLLVNSTTKLNTPLTENVSLSTAVVVNHDSAPPQTAPPPAPQRLTTDVALTVGVEAAL